MDSTRDPGVGAKMPGHEQNGAVSAATVRDQVDRILRSGVLSGSELLRNTRKTERGAIRSLLSLAVRAAPFALLRSLLSFLAERTLDKPGEAIKEYELATGVLGRPPAPDPSCGRGPSAAGTALALRRLRPPLAVPRNRAVSRQRKRPGDSTIPAPDPPDASVLPGVFPPPKNVAFPLPVSVSAQTFNLGSGPFLVPLVYNWNIAVEHEFGGDWLGRIAYVGSHSSHLQLKTDLNPATYIPGSNLSVDKRRIFQNYSDVFLNDESGNANFNSMQVTLQKRFARGMSLLANYTFEKSIDNVPPGGGSGASVAGGGSNAPLPWYVPGGSQLDYGPSEFDREHVFVLSYVWDIPKPPGSNAFVTALLGNWEITGIVSAETGFPFTIYAGKDISGSGLNADRGVYVGGNVLGSTACHSAPCVSWLNPQAFALPAKGTVGNVGKGAIFGPGLFNWDMGIFKNIPITERWSAQLRGEFFNALNHPNFTNSGNNYPNNSVNSAGFGTITAAYDPRIIQLALKVFF